MELIENLKWRYATKKFDTSKKVSSNDLQKLKEAVQLSVSSYGLQLYKVLIIENSEIREQLKPVSWNQSQITDASHLFVFCNYTDATPDAIDDFIKQTAETRNLDLERLNGYGDFIKEKLNEKIPEEKTGWLKSQTYLALGNLLNACAELKIDACPMEGFEPEAYNKILGLEQQGLNAAVIAPIGYRHDKDHTIGQQKVRKPMDVLFETV
ncbi:NAD(P)H-dependent oxidoreductase [Flavobacteriaceae bacterium S0825]|uniref:NAD(P)H-dependent oxidoreductase n=1 Tax=Gaetbulibacter sp. S0825 TaxID=2720084 RepID=UPI00142F88E6|nr:NAD(P)H-dependent oxidoreductase [Gaetbulibacter sp. S0825]MCK0107900.1 NAD(P)H-dependent oxidoreductase [Flavobacteriaceae bacterium S0825]NIX63536.1 NAD(P)H-dependent oxidoreductase [Gaetbulibacter sp. S0825]